MRSVDADQVLSDVVVAARNVLTGADAVTFSALRHGQVLTVASTAATATAVDEAQYRANEGPCLEALATLTIVAVDDLHGETRWPRFRATLDNTPFRSSLSSGVADGEQRAAIGSLNNYGETPAGFTAEDSETALLLSAYLAAVMSLADKATVADQRASQLTEAIQTRDVIGQAKGILMERGKISADEAFDVLVRASQALNRKLRDVADEVTFTGRLPVAGR